jgi:hypothetical protein
MQFATSKDSTAKNRRFSPTDRLVGSGCSLCVDRAVWQLVMVGFEEQKSAPQSEQYGGADGDQHHP